MARPKGQPKLGGRRKGTPNKFTAAIKEMVTIALDRAGGVDYLVRQAEQNPVAFLGLVGKVLPLQLTGAGDGPIEITAVERRIIHMNPPLKLISNAARIVSP